MTKNALTLALMLCATVLPGAARAEDCLYQRCYGAVALGPNKAWGYAYNQISKQAAIKVAQRNCPGTCGVVESFYNSCGAFAVGDNGGWGYANGATRSEAEIAAIDYCAPTGVNCQPIVSICSPP